MSDEQTLPWNQFWNLIAKNGHSKTEAEEGIKKITEILRKHVLKELKSEKHFFLRLDCYHSDGIPNLYRLFVNLTLLDEIPLIEQGGEPGSPIYLFAGNGTKPPNPPNPGPPNPVFANLILENNLTFDTVIADNKFLVKTSTIMF
jgi:hypothetical protein